MWQLELLSRVIPAFGALAKTFWQNDEDARLHRDAHGCYADLVQIGHTLSISCGEWASGLNDGVLDRLMVALNSRIPIPKKSFKISFFETKPPEKLQLPKDARTRFPYLTCLADSIEVLGWNGFDECSQILNQSMARHHQFQSLLENQRIKLFTREEKQNPDKRHKFLKRVREAAKHLLDVYIGHETGAGMEAFHLPQHPSHGMKGLADKVYNALEENWQCKCSQRSHGSREARISLVRHRLMGTNIPKYNDLSSAYNTAKFEIVLPLCKDRNDWKVTNIEFRHDRSCVATCSERKAVDKDICRYLLESDQSRLQVDFVIEKEKMWHLKPELLEDTQNHPKMEPLWRLLGDGLSRSYVSSCRPLDQVLLCYILANSMLYLYPGSWIQREWSSNMLYFIHDSSGSHTPVLAFPYMAVKIHKQEGAPETVVDHMQAHIHPAILGLGIIFLEIMTGKRFSRSTENKLWQRRNEDTWKARQLLGEIERSNRSNRVPSGIIKAARRCLKLEPPSNFPSNQLADEGPIRHYILTCIVGPLAHELQTGYKVHLDDLHAQLIPEKPKVSVGDDEDIGETSRLSAVNEGVGTKGNNQIQAANQLPIHQYNGPTSDPQTSFVEQREACLFRDRAEVVEEAKKNAAEEWFRWHTDAHIRIDSLRDSEICNMQRVKIAILDSGIELSERNSNIYNFEPKIRYKNWVDDSTEWKDDVGHGTHLAVLLRQIARNSAIHAHRVFKKNPTKKSAPIIAKAIRHLVDEEDIDIVVMSFGFGEIEDNLDNAIQYAASQGVLMFAAASNDGKNRPDGVSWPARDHNVICVHSGDGYGTPSSFTPEPEDSMRIMVLGECVKSAWPEKLQCPKGNRLMSGTSCATPIAAGIAALILDYAKGFMSDAEWKRLRRVNSMRKVFETISSKTNQNYRWVKHWVLFDQKRQEDRIQEDIKQMLQ